MPKAERPVSALPSPFARALAFAAILVAGGCGALIGWSFIDVQCGPPAENCATSQGVGAVVGGLMAAVGVAVVSVLTLRAMGEWQTIKAQQETEMSPSVGEPD